MIYFSIHQKKKQTKQNSCPLIDHHILNTVSLYLYQTRTIFLSELLTIQHKNQIAIAMHLQSVMSPTLQTYTLQSDLHEQRQHPDGKHKW